MLEHLMPAFEWLLNSYECRASDGQTLRKEARAVSQPKRLG